MKGSLLGLLGLLLLTLGATDTPGESLRYGRFGTVNLYRQSSVPSWVVLFVSGDGGWNQGVVDMARALSSMDALVVGIDITQYLKGLATSTEECSYPAGDFELLSKFVQKKLDFPQYVQPVLLGYSSGATLVYAILVQSPPNTFFGAISLGFCPDLVLTKPLCKGDGLEWRPGLKGRGYRFLPAEDLEMPWIALQGTIDQVCDAAATEAYVRQVRNGEIVLLPKVGHGFSVQRNWMPQFRQAFLQLVARKRAVRPEEEGALKDLPLVEVPSKVADPDLFAVVISGDGGWAGIDRYLADTLSSKGVSVVGLNSLQYFWKARTPDGAARDLGRIVAHYLTSWQKREVILIGYSRGADVLPFMANRLPRELLDRVRLIVLLGPGEKVGFQFHVKEWIGEPSGKDVLPVLPEVVKLKGKKILCFHGIKETDSLCQNLDASLGKVIDMKGGHHFGGKYETLAEAILKELQ